LSYNRCMSRRLDTPELIAHIVRLRRAEREAAPDARAELGKVRAYFEALVGPTLTRAETARVLGLSQPALDRWVAKGEVPTVLTPEGRHEIPLPEVLSLAEEVERARAEQAGQVLARVIGERRRLSREAVDLDRLLPRRQRPRTHRAAEMQSLAYHRLVAERLDEPLVDAARQRLRRWRDERRVHPRWAAEWERILALPLPRIRREIGANTVRARELRQTSPFAGVLNEQERLLLRRAVEERLRA
jgi:hypothetical protein